MPDQTVSNIDPVALKYPTIQNNISSKLDFLITTG